jgi:hypothetical protein
MRGSNKTSGYYLGNLSGASDKVSSAPHSRGYQENCRKETRVTKQKQKQK